MRIGIATENTDMESVVSDKFAECKYLLIVSLNDYAYCKAVDVTGIKVIQNEGNDSGLKLAEELICNDCEAVITGELESVAFDLIADACITRYNGAGYQALNALELMERMELKLIRNVEGTDECDGSHHEHEH